MFEPRALTFVPPNPMHYEACFLVRNFECMLHAVLVVAVSSKSTAATRSRPHAMAPNGLSAASGPRIVGGYDAQPGEFPYQVRNREAARPRGQCRCA